MELRGAETSQALRPGFQLITWRESAWSVHNQQHRTCDRRHSHGTGRLFLLDLSDDRIVSLNSDGSDRKVIVTECRHPDGIAVDVAAGHIYWTNMGVPKVNDGSIERADLDGRNRMTIVPQGGTFTPKQLQLEKKSRKLYWCDREGMRVMRANLDGSNIETLVDTSQGDPRPGPDATKWCVGVAVDTRRRQGLLDAEGCRQRRQGPHLPRRHRRSHRTRARPIDQTSKFSTTGCPSRSIWTSI